MKLQTVAIALSITTLFCWESAKELPAAERPNVVLILVDDLGALDLNCYGSADLSTDHLDGLAARGVRFSQFYASAPVCSASRVGFLTGRYPVRAGQPGNGPMPADEKTIAELFAESGYDTGHVGKWHLGVGPGQSPLEQGFRSSYGHMEGCIDNYAHFFFWAGPNRHDLWRDGKEIWEDGKFFPDLMVRECKTFLDQPREKPFLLYWAFNAPHYPYQGTDRWRKHYAKSPSPRDKYAAFVSTMDESIGQVLEHLRDTGLDQNTIVVFQSDHGHSTETRAFGGGGNAGPYRGAKFSLFEGGIRVPAIIAWPNHIGRGEVRGEMGTGCDWLPTLAQYCDVDVDASTLDGKSLVDVIGSANAKSPHDVYQWQFGGNNQPQWAVRSGPWKLIGNPIDTTQSQTQRKDSGRLKDKRFLVNLDDDPSETTNLAQQHAEIAKKLQSHRDQLITAIRSR
ncbi:MAG: sulfatase-like hydrolase/transferase [Pirellulaceae bacterium]|nr:sulfatase-like hydrolase/transferase [Pirellulaceae bacterium]